MSGLPCGWVASHPQGHGPARRGRLVWLMCRVWLAVPMHELVRKSWLTSTSVDGMKWAWNELSTMWMSRPLTHWDMGLWEKGLPIKRKYAEWWPCHGNLLVQLAILNATRISCPLCRWAGLSFTGTWVCKREGYLSDKRYVGCKWSHRPWWVKWHTVYMV